MTDKKNTEQVKSWAQERARVNADLLKEPCFTVEEREIFREWLCQLEDKMTSVIHALMPPEAWDKNPDQMIYFTLVGNNTRHNIPRGMYCLDIPPEMPEKYRDPLTLAFVTWGAAPDNIRRLPEVVSRSFTKPTAHEVFSGKMFIRKFIQDNQEDPDILEWAEKLV